MMEMMARWGEESQKLETVGSHYYPQGLEGQGGGIFFHSLKMRTTLGKLDSKYPAGDSPTGLETAEKGDFPMEPESPRR